MNQDKIRNIAIIAHVDHGKTTLVDSMLKQTKTFAEHQQENNITTIMDSNELERERGVTILAKNTAVFWHDYKINILDTPGHADFSGEVERVLNMADGCILLVDAAEGVLSQTRFVLRLALELGLQPIVLINKVDRKDQRVSEVEGEIADLFLELATNDNQLDFPILYGRGIEGIAGKNIEEQPDFSMVITDSSDLTPLFEAITTTIPSPEGNPDEPFQLQVTSLDWDDYKGKITVGRVARGTVKKGQTVKIINTQGEMRSATLSYVFTHAGLNRQEVDQASAGDIIALAGIADPQIGETIADPQQPEALPPLSISEPTVKMQMMVNTSPFAGRDAQFSTSRQIKDRLRKELETNVGLRMLPGTGAESVTIVGRGEHHTGKITSAMAQRRAILKNMHQTKTGVRFEYEISTGNLIGYRSELLTTTSGEGIMHSTFLDYRNIVDTAGWNRGGALIAHETGTVTAYALEKAQQRGTMFVDPGDEVYAGQVVGLNNRSESMTMNVVKGKKLTNMRASSADATVVLAPSWKPSLEQFLTIIAEDELLEVTPNFLRLRIA
jgi:GTP-binding protein